MKNFINRIAEIRNAKGLTQDELALKAEISRPYLSEVENDKSVPTIDVSMRIAGALGVTVGEIFLPNVSTM